MRLLRPALLVAAIALAGCGGDEMSADDYRAELNTACEKLADTNVGLPQRVQDENLDLDEARQIAEEAGDEFEDTVRDLEPPDELADAHERLIAVGEEAPTDGDDPQALRDWVLEIADVYGDLGATRCEERQRESAEMLAAASG